MIHCLNKRIKSYASQTNEQTDLPEKLQTRIKSESEELQNSPDEGRRPSIDKLTDRQKRLILEEIVDFYEELKAFHGIE